MERLGVKRVALYARVSTRDQNPDLQVKDLAEYADRRGWGDPLIFIDRGVSGAKDSRPELDRLMEAVRKRQVDVVLVWRFDRFARSTTHLLVALEEFRTLSVDFVSYQENIDTSTPLGQVLFTIVAAVAQLERNIIRERVQAGVNRAILAGKRFGRPCAFFDLERAKELVSAPFGYGLRRIGKEMNVSRETVRRAFSRAGIRLTQKPSQKRGTGSVETNSKK